MALEFEKLISYELFRLQLKLGNDLNIFSCTVARLSRAEQAYGVKSNFQTNVQTFNA